MQKYVWNGRKNAIATNNPVKKKSYIILNHFILFITLFIDSLSLDGGKHRKNERWKGRFSKSMTLAAVWFIQFRVLTNRLKVTRPAKKYICCIFSRDERIKYQTARLLHLMILNENSQRFLYPFCLFFTLNILVRISIARIACSQQFRQKSFEFQEYVLLFVSYSQTKINICYAISSWRMIVIRQMGDELDGIKRWGTEKEYIDFKTNSMNSPDQFHWLQCVQQFVFVFLL